MLQAIVQINEAAVYLSGQNIDTDRIVPARFLKTVSFEALANALFYDDRYQDSKVNRQHPLHRQPKPGIIIVDANFGCGSSREHAAQAIKLWGIKAIVGRSFGDIFRGNCQHLGIPCLEVNTSTHRQITDFLSSESKPLTISLADLTISAGEQLWPCQLSKDSQRAFLDGTYDPLQLLLRHKEKIAAHAEQHPPVLSRFL